MESTNQSLKRIIFKFDQHGVIVTEKLQSFYEQKEFFDTILMAGSNNVSIQAHRVVLCALSEYFFELFRGDQSALKGNIVELKEIEASKLKLIIDFIYSGSIKLSLEMVEEILRTATFLKIKSLVDACCEFIEENIDSSYSLSWFRLAYELNLPELKTKALECIYTKFKKISKEKEFLMLSENEFKDLLFNDNRCGDFEEDVFLAMVAWIKHDKSNREHLVFQLLSMVRFQALTPKFILVNRKSICKTVESYELICSWLQWHLAPEAQTNDHKSVTYNPKKMTNKLALAKFWETEGKIEIENFDPKQNSWCVEIETQLPKGLSNFSSILINCKLIVAAIDSLTSEYTLECFDLRSSEWTNIAIIRNYRTVFNMANLNENLCALCYDSDLDSFCLGIYNFSTCKWDELPPPPHKITIWNKMAAYNEMLYICDFTSGYLQSYNVSSNKWISKKIEHQNLVVIDGFAAIEGFLYFIGDDYEKLGVKTLERFNLSNDTWCEMASLPSACEGFLHITVFENKIIVNDFCNIYEYNINSDTWNASIPFERDLDRYKAFNVGYPGFIGNKPPTVIG